MNKDFFLSLDAEGLIRYFEEKRDESSQLEFKSGKAKPKDIYQEICAFANTDGGILIYGSPIEQEESLTGGGKRTFCIGAIEPCVSKQSEDDLLSSIRTQIIPAPPNISLKRLEVSGGCVYIICVSKSNNKPHQYNTRYYIRANTMSVPAEHGIVEMMFKQASDIDLYLEVTHYTDKLNKSTSNIGLNIKNKTRLPAQKVELWFSLIGECTQVIQQDSSRELEKDYKLTNMHIGNGYRSLTKLCHFPHAVIDRIWAWYVACDIMFYGQYCYLEVVYWAAEVPAKIEYFKIFKDVTKNIESIDLDSDTPERKEYLNWKGKVENE